MASSDGQFRSSSNDDLESISLSKVKISTISTISDLAKNLSVRGDHVSDVNSNSSNNVNNSRSLSHQSLNQSKFCLDNNQSISLDVIDFIPKVMEFTWFDVLLNLVSIFCYLIDVVSDLVTCYVHYKTKNFVFFYLTMLFIIVPTLITTFISLRWYINDAKNEGSPVVTRTRWIVRSLFLFFQMGQIMRYIDSLAFGIKYMNKPHVKYYQSMVHEDTDATMLRLFECFLESAPQLLIQLYLIIMVPMKTGNISNSDMLFYVLFPYFSCCISLFSIALALASYYKSLRMSLPNKVNLNMLEMCVQIAWRLFMLTSRMLALTLFITSFNYFIIFVILLHWFIMFLWILTMKTNFCENLIEEVFYDALVAIMFIFCFFNPIDNDTRERYSLFFTFMLVENTFLLYLWSQDCAHRNNLPCSYKFELISLYYVCFLVGIVIMILYYLYCHPTRKIKFFRTEQDLEVNRRRHSYVSRDQQRRVFDERDWTTEDQIKRIKEHLSQTNSLYDTVDIKQIGKIKTAFRRKRDR